MAHIPFKKLQLCGTLAVLLLHFNSASALGLMQAYEAALQNDSTYRSAQYENQASKEYAKIGKSYLLPNVSINYSASKNHAEVTARDFLGRANTTNPEYTSTVGSLSLRQPILNLDGVARYRQGIAQVSANEAAYVGRSQELILRLVSAYADVQYAKDQLALAIAQRDAYLEQKRVNDRLFQKGEGTRTDVLETQAKLDVSEAQLIEVRDSLVVAKNTLASIVGMDVTTLDGLSDDFRVKPMQPASFEEWKALALENNADIKSQRFVIEMAVQEVKKSRAGHAPRLDMVASYSKNESETLNTYNQDSTVRSIGIQLNIPLYAGGYVTAVTNQAVANQERAKADLAAKTDKILVELRKQYSLALSSKARIEALVKSVESSRLLIQATQESVKGGVRINLDVLNAKQQYYAAKRDLAQARYNYLQSYLRLRYEAGTLNIEDLREVASYFVPSNS